MERTGRPNVMSGGVGGRRRGGTLAVTSGLAKETLLRRFGTGLFDERQDCWRETDNGWRTTDVLTAEGGRPLRGGSAACASSGVWQGLRRCVEMISVLVPI